MSEKNPIKKVVLDLSGKEVSLTVKQAQQLKEALDEMFSKEKIVYRDHYPSWPWHWRWHCEVPTWTGYGIYYSDSTGSMSVEPGDAVLTSYNANDATMTLSVV